jgi:hypothetical protein
MNFRLLLVLLAVSLVSCKAQVPRPKQPAESLPEFPIELYQEAPTSNLYRIDSERSLVEVIVRRGGKLARFGHDHVVSSGPLDGFVIRDPDILENSQADLRLDLTSLHVDRPELRAQLQLDTQPTEADIEKTAENMQTKVLQTQTWREIHLHIDAVGGTPALLQAELTIMLHGEVHKLPIAINIDSPDHQTLLAHGAFTLLQSDYGIEPFSVLGGGLRVEDAVEIRYRMEARRFDWTGAD